MRPRWLTIHECLTSGPVLVANFEVFHHLCYCGDRHFLYILYEDSLLWGFSEFQSSLLVDMQQISELLVVELDVRAHYQKILGLVALGWLEDRLEATRNDALLLLVLQVSHHCVRLARTGLPIREDSAIVALQYFLGEVLAGGLKQIQLRGSGLEDIIKREGFGVFSLWVNVSHCQLLLVGVTGQKISVGCIVREVPFAVSFSVKGRTRTKTFIHSSGISNNQFLRNI